MLHYVIRRYATLQDITLHCKSIAIEVPGGNRNLVIKIITQQIILRNAILKHEIEHFKKIYLELTFRHLTLTSFIVI